jgi:hypothetical protein
MLRAAMNFKPLSTGDRLDDLLVSRFLPRYWGSRIWSSCELPDRLEHCARNLAPNAVWRAYGDDEQMFFAIACAHQRDSQPSSCLAIDVHFLDGNADVYSAGVWEHDAYQGWWLNLNTVARLTRTATSDCQRDTDLGVH